MFKPVTRRAAPADLLQRRITLRNFVEAVPLDLKTHGFEPIFKSEMLVLNFSSGLVLTAESQTVAF
jgi:hypothetical protein